MAREWGCSPDALAAHRPDGTVVYRLIDDLGAEERWTLFDLMDHGGSSPVDLYPRRVDSEGQWIAVDESVLLGSGLVFSARSNYVVPTELRADIHRYRGQLLLMQVRALIDASNEEAARLPPFEIPEQIQPSLALSHLLSGSDPEGFRFPLSRALSIPDMFPASVKRLLKRFLHEFYLLFVPTFGTLDAGRVHPIETAVRLATGVSAVLSHQYTPRLDPSLCIDENRPFASANTLLSGARRALFRSYVVLFAEQFLSPIGALRIVGDGFQVLPRAFVGLDLESKRPTWLVDSLVELGADKAFGRAG